VDRGGLEAGERRLSDYFFLEAESIRLKDVKLPPGRSYIVKPSSRSKRHGMRMLKNGGDLPDGETLSQGYANTS
jgi:hypothetical protein